MQLGLRKSQADHKVIMLYPQTILYQTLPWCEDPDEDKMDNLANATLQGDSR